MLNDSHAGDLHQAVEIDPTCRNATLARRTTGPHCRLMVGEYGLFRVTRNVRREYDVRQAQEWMSASEGLLWEDVEAGTGDVAVLKESSKRGVVIDRPLLVTTSVAPRGKDFSRASLSRPRVSALAGVWTERMSTSCNRVSAAGETRAPTRSAELVRAHRRCSCRPTYR